MVAGNGTKQRTDLDVNVAWIKEFYLLYLNSTFSNVKKNHLRRVMDSKDHSTFNQRQQFDWMYSDSYQSLLNKMISKVTRSRNV
jgi:hypothetical protein